MSKAKEYTSQLWDMANKLRGTMDASEYKNYILPFMFYRYLSSHQDEYLKENSLLDFYDAKEDEIEDYLEDISSSIGYVIEKEYTWNNIVDKIINKKIIASDYQDLLDHFKTNVRRNEKTSDIFLNVFSDVNIGDTRLGSEINERANALNEIVLMINNFDFKDETGHDILGDVYEYLIGEFAASAGKKGGEFYTPHEVSKILAKIVTDGVKDDGNQFKVYDPTMGSGSLLLTVKKELSFGEKEGSVDFYGQELNATTYNLATMNLMMHGVEYSNMNLKRGDTLAVDWPSIKDNEIEIPTVFDAVVSNPPYSQKWETKKIDREKDPRFKDYGIAPSSKADYAFILHGLYHLDKNGTMAIVLPHGILFRGAQEEKIRKNIIKNNLLDVVIGLPPNLFYGTPIPTCILVFKGVETRKKCKDVLIIDASSDFEKSKAKNKLRDCDIDKIIDTYKNRKEIERYSHVATFEEIENNGFNLNIPRYVDTYVEEETIDLTEIAKELIKTNEEIDKMTEELSNMMKELIGTDENISKELEEFISLFDRIKH